MSYKLIAYGGRKLSSVVQAKLVQEIPVDFLIAADVFQPPVSVQALAVQDGEVNHLAVIRLVCQLGPLEKIEGEYLVHSHFSDLGVCQLLVVFGRVLSENLHLVIV